MKHNRREIRQMEAAGDVEDIDNSYLREEVTATTSTSRRGFASLVP
ncbi:hypothetical protein L915_07078 [Phytophthora nicotianae]|uniref:Uncharacterized protein n=1 Tax=Phytophthora nicotianae TaxID=4792 RepID=W2J933_PHYNI|nr:hypothetical protein L915_07078 [Phytophthora nicotianae]ETL42098.1 hypothetical protein L916_07030 [Phytophthora nicotianae]